MLIYCNPDEKKLAELFVASKYNAAKWVKDLDTGVIEGELLIEAGDNR